jgi:protein arginine kinase
VTKKRKEPQEPPDFRAGEWLSARGPEADIAVCTRVRLARNLQGFHFSVAMSESEARDLNKFVCDRLTRPGLPEQLRVVALEGLDELEREALVERHLISREQARSKKSRSVAVNEPESVAVMVNEEDHLRSQVFLSGLQPEAAWQRAEALDDALFQRLPMACSEEFGFLTSCPTNLGTGMRLSVMLHLPALVWTEEIEKATNTAQKIHLAVRGLYGEGSKALGDFYQVSNQVTLGRSEAQIVGDVQLAVSRLVQWERDFREALLRDQSRLRTLDRVHRALGTIERCQILTSEEALNCLSAIRFGVQQGLLEGIAIANVNKALLLTQPAHLQRFTKERLDAAGRDQRRAALLRNILGCEP